MLSTYVECPQLKQPMLLPWVGISTQPKFLTYTPAICNNQCFSFILPPFHSSNQIQILSNPTNLNGVYVTD